MITSKIIAQGHAWQCKKTLVTSLLFKEFLSFFTWSIPRDIPWTNKKFIDFIWAWFTCNLRGNRISTNTWAKHGDFAFTPLHVLHTLYVICFKPFKIGKKQKHG